MKLIQAILFIAVCCSSSIAYCEKPKSDIKPKVCPSEGCRPDEDNSEGN